jgi:tryptophan halogenase
LVDYTDYFPARSVMAWWDDKPKVLNYTDITAMKYGWTWNINLKHRSGNGYIFDPDLISPDKAQEEVETKLGHKIEPVASLRFTPSLMDNSWRNNVIAVGLSTGFLEPLESNGLAAVVAQLQHLCEYWVPESADNKIDQITYNKDYISTMNDIRDFLSLHYRGHRRDTEFWRSHGEDPKRVSDVLKHRMKMWEEGILGVGDMAGYGLENYATVIQGLNLINRDKLQARLLSKRATIFDDFNRSYNKLS